MDCKMSLMSAVRSRKGTHAKGSCEPGQAGRCSHKQRTLVQWISLSQSPCGGQSYNKAHGIVDISLRVMKFYHAERDAYYPVGFFIRAGAPMAKKKTSTDDPPETPAA